MRTSVSLPLLMRRLLRAGSIACFIGACALVVLVLSHSDTATLSLLAIRDRLFSSYAADSTELNRPPEAMTALGFRQFSPERMKRLGRSLPDSLRNQFALISLRPTATERVQELVRVVSQ